MKFDIAIGNPPYQSDRFGTSTTALPIYHQFMDAADQVATGVLLIHPARFLFNAGRTPKEWNKKMLTSPHFKVKEYVEDGSKIFPNTDIKGGVAISYYDSSKTFEPIETFTISPLLKNLLSLVGAHKDEFESISNIVDVATKFNTDNLFQDYPSYKGHERRMSSNVLTFDCFHENKEKDNIRIYGVIKNKRQSRYINSKYVDQSPEYLSKYKVIMPKADGSGTFGEKSATPQIIPPNSGFTHTFMSFGAFETETEAVNLSQYLKTKFARVLLHILKVTQDNNADKWRMVPLQDFTDNSDIDWSKPIPEIDQQLYRKYGLSDDEITFIEEKVQAME